VLIDVKLSRLEPCETCFLIIEHEGDEYVGALLFGDPLFCRQVFELLNEHMGEFIQQIGELDISHLLLSNSAVSLDSRGDIAAPLDATQAQRRVRTCQ
jgi:hypothetical protein